MMKNPKSLRLALHETFICYGSYEPIIDRDLGEYCGQYSVKVNYNLSVEQAVKLGHYHFSDEHFVRQNFYTKKKGTKDVVIRLVQFPRMVTTKYARSELKEMGYRPCTLHELLAFGEKFPQKQLEFPIVALGSVWKDDGDEIFPYLYSDGRSRNLGPACPWVGWASAFRFAVVRVSAKT